jgi:hypothetical protein
VAPLAWFLRHLLTVAFTVALVGLEQWSIVNIRVDARNAKMISSAGNRDFRLLTSKTASESIEANCAHLFM